MHGSNFEFQLLPNHFPKAGRVTCALCILLANGAHEFPTRILCVHSHDLKSIAFIASHVRSSLYKSETRKTLSQWSLVYLLQRLRTNGFRLAPKDSCVASERNSVGTHSTCHPTCNRHRKAVAPAQVCEPRGARSKGPALRCCFPDSNSLIVVVCQIALSGSFPFGLL